MLPVLLCVVSIVFLLVHISPGDPSATILGELATPEEYEMCRESLGLNDPFLVQLGRYLYKLIFKLDMGNSYVNGLPVLREILVRYPITLKLALLSVGFGLMLGLVFGIISAVKQYSILDNISVTVSLMGIAAPIFWTSLLLILIFSVKLNLLPASGTQNWLGWVLPSFVFAIQNGAIIMRMTRSSMLEVIRQDYIRTAKAKGQRQIVVIIRHALRNALVPIITTVGNQLCVALAGATVVETIFALPGLGRFLIDSLNAKDYVMVQGIVLWIGVNCVVVNLITDLSYAFFDPQIRASYDNKKLIKIRRRKVS